MSLSTQKLAQLIAKKRDILARLLKLASGQTGQISNGQISSLLETLTAKQAWLGELQKLDTELAPYHGEDPESRSWESPEHRQQCQKDAAQCEAILAKLMEIEAVAQAQLGQRKEEVSQRLDSGHKQAEAGRAYLSAANVSSSQLDLASEG
jgi:hypothetical protein